MASQSHAAASQTRVMEVMTRQPAFLSADQTVDQAAKIMAELGVGALPICEDEQIIGILTDRDITVRCTATGKPPGECRVVDAMSPKVQWCSEDDTVDVARHKMESKRIRRLPVVDRDRHLVGILTLGDLATRSGDAAGVLKRVSPPAATGDQ